jgi:hypothetical protein
MEIGRKGLGMKTPSATDVNEAELAHWLFTAFMSSRPIAEELCFIPEMQLAFMMDRKVLAPIARGPGDIDVLAANATYPEQAIAVEVKRVKMPSGSYSTSLPNKLQELEKGCTQVGLLREIGFHRSHLLVAVVADGREQTEVSFAFRGPTPALVKAVKEKLRSLKFHPDVGVVVVEATQPVDKDIQDSGAIGIWTHQGASMIQQPPELTANIAKFFQASH